MNENELYVVKEYKFDNPVITKIDSLIDKYYRDYHNNNIIHLNINVNLILKLQISLIMKQLI